MGRVGGDGWASRGGGPRPTLRPPFDVTKLQPSVPTMQRVLEEEAGERVVERHRSGRRPWGGEAVWRLAQSGLPRPARPQSGPQGDPLSPMPPLSLPDPHSPPLASPASPAPSCPVPSRSTATLRCGGVRLAGTGRAPSPAPALPVRADPPGPTPPVPALPARVRPALLLPNPPARAHLPLPLLFLVWQPTLLALSPRQVDAGLYNFKFGDGSTVGARYTYTYGYSPTVRPGGGAGGGEGVGGMGVGRAAGGLGWRLGGWEAAGG